MKLREATIEDIPQLMNIRLSVKENILTNPNLVPYEDYVEFLTQRGKGWVCELNSEIVGFSVVDLQENNIWALFIHPDFEKKGIGKQLHQTMLNWYFEQSKKPVWLGTEPNSRAEEFYRKAGWKAIGMHGENEIKFEMNLENWSTNCINE
jgi:GNAT superfamily N-acetyltransferase